MGEIIKTGKSELSSIKFPMTRKELQTRMKFPSPDSPKPPFDNVSVMDGTETSLPLPKFITTKTSVKSDREFTGFFKATFKWIATTDR